MASIQGVYLALFGRPADPLGLAFFNSATNNGANLTAIGDLSASAEYQTRFTGQSNTQIITSIYRSLFNRDPDLAGLTFFATALANKTLTINNIAIAIFDGAQGSDVTIRDLKVAAANSFTSAIDTVAEINGYAGTNAAASGAAFIATVTTTAPTQAQIDAAVATATTQTNPGPLTNLTANADALIGTSGNDTFIGATSATAASNTYSAADNINGGSGTDTLNVTLAGAAAGPAIVQNVEIINVRGTDAAVANNTFNAGSVTGATQFWSDNSTGPTAITGIQAAATLGVRGGSNTVQSFVYRDTVIASAATAGSQAIALDGADVARLRIGTATAGGNEFTTLNVDVTGANRIRAAAVDLNGDADTLDAGEAVGNSILTTDNNAFDATTTINVTGAGSLRIDGALAATVTTINAGTNAGGVRLTLAAGSGDVAFTGGAGGDRLDVGASLTATDTINGGAGTDRIIISDADTITATAGARVTNFEVLEASAADGTAYNVARIAGITSLIDSHTGGGTLTFDAVTKAQGLTINGDAPAATTVNFSDAGPGGTDAYTVTLDNGNDNANGVDVTTLLVNNIDNLTINSIGGANPAAEASVGLAGNTDLNTVTVTGGNATLVTTGAIAADTIDANAATGRISVDASANTAAMSITGGSAAAGDLLWATANGDVVNAGAGTDTVVGGVGGDVLNGGLGNDIILVGNVADVDASGATNFADVVAITGIAGNSAGNDTAQDRVVFNSALGATNVDTIVGFDAVAGATQDLIVIDDEIFVGIGTGTGSASSGGATLARYGEGATLADAIVAGPATGAAIYAVTNGANVDLFFDADGSGSGAAVQFANLVGVTLANLDASDFRVI